MRPQTHLGKTLLIEDNQIVAEEDLIVDCKVTASRIEVGNSTIVVGLKSEISADLHGRVIEVIGTVNGNITASELIAINDTAVVNGDIAAPKIELAKRCRFNGRLSYT